MCGVLESVPLDVRLPRERVDPRADRLPQLGDRLERLKPVRDDQLDLGQALATGIAGLVEQRASLLEVVLEPDPVRVRRHRRRDSAAAACRPGQARARILRRRGGRGRRRDENAFRTSSFENGGRSARKPMYWRPSSGTTSLSVRGLVLGDRVVRRGEGRGGPRATARSSSSPWHRRRSGSRRRSRGRPSSAGSPAGVRGRRRTRRARRGRCRRDSRAPPTSSPSVSQT